MDTPDNQQNEQNKIQPLFNHDIATIILAITFLSTILSFLFNLSYFLSFNPSLLMMFSVSDYFSTGVYFVALVVAIATWKWLSEDYKSLFLSKKEFETQKRKEASHKAEQDKRSEKIAQIKNAPSYDEIWKKADDVVKPIKHAYFLSRMWIQIFGVAIWVLFAFPRFDWLAISILLHAIVSLTPTLFRYRSYSEFERNLLVYFSTIVTLTFYAGAVCATALPISPYDARIVYEQEGKPSEIKGNIIRVLSKSLIVKTDQGFSVLDRDTPLQIFYEKRKNSYNVNGIWWITRYLSDHRTNEIPLEKTKVYSK